MNVCLQDKKEKKKNTTPNPTHPPTHPNIVLAFPTQNKKGLTTKIIGNCRLLLQYLFITALVNYNRQIWYVCKLLLIALNVKRRCGGGGQIPFSPQRSDDSAVALALAKKNNQALSAHHDVTLVRRLRHQVTRESRGSEVRDGAPTGEEGEGRRPVGAAPAARRRIARIACVQVDLVQPVPASSSSSPTSSGDDHHLSPPPPQWPHPAEDFFATGGRGCRPRRDLGRLEGEGFEECWNITKRERETHDEST